MAGRGGGFLAALRLLLGPIALLLGFFWVIISLFHFADDFPYLDCGGPFRAYLNAFYGRYTWEAVCIWLGSLALLCGLLNFGSQASRGRAFFAAGLSAFLALFSIIWFIVVVAGHASFKDKVSRNKSPYARKYKKYCLADDEYPDVMTYMLAGHWPAFLGAFFYLVAAGGFAFAGVGITA